MATLEITINIWECFKATLPEYYSMQGIARHIVKDSNRWILEHQFKIDRVDFKPAWDRVTITYSATRDKYSHIQ